MNRSGMPGSALASSLWTGSIGRGERLSPRQIFAIVMGMLSLVILIYGTTYDTRIAFVPVALLGGIVLLVSAETRFIFVTFGGLLVLQSSPGIDERKLLYFVGCAIAFGIGVLRLQMIKSPHVRVVLKGFAVVSVSWIAICGVSLFVAFIHGTATSSWLRDVLPYLLLAAMPIAVADLTVSLERSPQSRFPTVVFVAYGLVSAIVFATTWIERRGYAELPIAGAMLSSFAVVAAFFCYSCAKFLTGSRHTVAWGVLAASSFILVILTGTRTGLILLLAPLAVILHQHAYFSRVVTRAFLMTLAGAVFGFVALGVARFFGVLDLSAIISRFVALGGMFSNSPEGQSFDDRTLQTQLTLEAFLQSPIVGIGPGHVYSWLAPYSTSLQSSLVVDSPVSIAAKFGVLGAVCFGLTLATIYLFAKLLAKQDGAYTEGSAIFGYLAITVVLSWLGSPIEDKGFSFALAFLLVLGVQRIIQFENGAASPWRP